jgi:hypothetical protein
MRASDWAEVLRFPNRGRAEKFRNGPATLRPFYSFGMTISLVPNSFRIIFAFQIAPNRHKLRVMAGT